MTQLAHANLFENLTLNCPRGTLAPLNRAKNFKEVANMHMNGINIEFGIE